MPAPVDETTRAKRNQKRRERRHSNPAMKAKEQEYRKANADTIALYRTKHRDQRNTYKRAHRRRCPNEAIGYAHRTGRDLVRSGILSLSVMGEIEDRHHLSVLDELIARDEALEAST